MQSLKYSFFAFLAITAIAVIGRVFVSFVLISATVGQTLSVTNSPFSLQQIISLVTGGFGDVTSIAKPITGQYKIISVLDPPAELESLRKARDARLSRTISVLDAPARLEELRKARDAQRLQTITVLDAPAGFEQRRKAQDARRRSSGPLIINVGE